MGIAMVAMLAFGGTYAYFTATTSGDTANNSATATTGTIKLGANSIGTLTTNVVSGEDVLASGQKVSVLNQSNRASFVFITFSATMGGSGNLAANKAGVNADGKYFLDYGVDEGWTQGDGTNIPSTTYWKYFVAGAVDNSTATTVCDSIKFYGNSQSTVTSGTASAGSLMGQTITLTITSEAIQAVDEDDGSAWTNVAADAQAAYAVLHS